MNDLSPDTIDLLEENIKEYGEIQNKEDQEDEIEIARQAIEDQSFRWRDA